MSDAIHLKTFRRTIFTPKEKPVIEALRGIMRGLLYRHEFAKRNPDVCRDSLEVLKAFGITPARAETFTCPNQKTYLTDELRAIYKKADPSKREGLNRLLGSFLKQRKILPMTMFRQPFFPEFNKKEAWKIWNSLLRFELFAMTYLKIGGPVMFPVMYVGGLSLNDTPNERQQLSKLLDLSQEPYPMLIKFELADGVTTNYMTAFGATLYQNYPELKNTTRNSPIKRVHDNDFDIILKAYDLKNYPPPRGEMEAERKKLHREQCPNKPHNSDAVSKAFFSWRKTARKLIEHYDIII